MEKQKIFISGLPFSCTKEQLEEICKSHGTIKDVRLVTYRSGKPKVRRKEEDRCPDVRLKIVILIELMITTFDHADAEQVQGVWSLLLIY